MKEKKYLLVGLVFGMAFGWALGFLRLPYLEKNFSFLLGFVAALTLVSLVLLWLTAWNRGFLAALIGKNTAAENPESARAQTRGWAILAGVLVLGVVLGGIAAWRQIGSLNLQVQNQEKRMRQLAALMEVMKQQDQGPLMRSVLEEVGSELKRSPGRTLSDTTIARIAALSFAVRPFRYVQGDSVSENAYSPERGQLLRALILMQIDSGAFARIKQQTLFAGADLSGADLKGLDLSGINLGEANLKDADLSGANLTGAQLGGANLWGARLNRANLGQADLKRADLSWAQLQEASLPSATLDGANLGNAQFIKADLNHASFQYAQLSGALFNEANLTGASFFATNLTKILLSRANLGAADLRLINLSEADVVGAQLDNALVDENWLEKVKKWKPRGANELGERYIVVNDTFDKAKSPLYRLKKN